MEEKGRNEWTLKMINNNTLEFGSKSARAHFPHCNPNKIDFFDRP